MKFLMGNEIIALGAIAAGVRFVSGYPGTPSTEILENVAKHNTGDIYVEWSVNEKVAMEVAVGAAYAGARALVTMKQVGLNVASDPLMSLAYIGIKGGMVIVVADDPGPISSQTEQDTRHFAQYSKIPIFDPSSPEEAYTMIGEAFEYSEKYQTPVLFRPTTRVCHGCTAIEIKKPREHTPIEGFIKDSKWVIFPRLAYMNHLKIEKRNVELGKEFSRTSLNRLDWQKTPFFEKAGSGSGTNIKRAIITGGVSYEYVREALALLGTQCTVLKVGTPHPFPEDLACDLLCGIGEIDSSVPHADKMPSEHYVHEILAIEELDPVLEKEMLCLVSKKHSLTKIYGKLTGHITQAGENSVESVKDALAKFLELSSDTSEKSEKSEKTDCSQTSGAENSVAEKMQVPPLPMRPPVLCAGCPHRASFYAVKKAMKGKKAVFSGDIGCYTLGNAAPLDMVDTCLCMGAGITIAQGMNRTISMEVAYNTKNSQERADISTPLLTEVGTNFAFIGDSTFFHTGIAGLVNAVYNKHNIVLVVLDNATTAMTGHQPHPGTGTTLMDRHNTLAGVETIAQKVSIEKVLTAIGIEFVQSVDPLNLDKAVEAAQLASEYACSGKGVSAIIYKSPCIAIVKPSELSIVDTQKCIGCKKCVQHLGCPAIVLAGQNVSDNTIEANAEQDVHTKVNVKNGKVRIEPSLCYGCGLCHYVCPVGAISKESLAQKEVR